MTELTANLQRTVNNTLQEVLNTKSKRTSILLWTNHNPELPNSFILKKEGKKYLGLPRTDKRGETYWKFYEIRNKNNQSKISPVMDNITKFQQRQNQIKDYDQPNKSESATVNQQSR